MKPIKFIFLSVVFLSFDSLAIRYPIKTFQMAVLSYKQNPTKEKLDEILENYPNVSSKAAIQTLDKILGKTYEQLVAERDEQDLISKKLADGTEVKKEATEEIKSLTENEKKEIERKLNLQTKYFYKWKLKVFRKERLIDDQVEQLFENEQTGPMFAKLFQDTIVEHTKNMSAESLKKLDPNIDTSFKILAENVSKEILNKAKTQNLISDTTKVELIEPRFRLLTSQFLKIKFNLLKRQVVVKAITKAFGLSEKDEPWIANILIGGVESAQTQAERAISAQEKRTRFAQFADFLIKNINSSRKMNFTTAQIDELKKEIVSDMEQID